MKNHLQAEADGRQFFKTYILFFIPILILSVLSSSPDGQESGMGILSIFQSYLSMLLEFSFFCYLITTVTYAGIGFPFSGNLRAFASKAALWLFLTIITLGIYGPWFGRNYMTYVLDNLSWNGKQARFLSTPRKLLVPLLLMLYVPAVILAVFGAVFFINTEGDFSAVQWSTLVLLSIAIILLAAQFVHVFLNWVINFEYSGKRVGFVSTSGETFRLILGQVLLTLITACIYAPAAWLKIYTYVVSRITIDDPEKDSKGILGFDGGVKEGFLFIWGQALLTIITVGVYGSWAMSRTTNWVLNRTYVSDETVLR